MTMDSPKMDSPTWGSWFRKKSSQAAGRVSGAVVRSSTAVLKRVVEFSTGARVETFIAEKLAEFIDVDIEIKSSGPISGSFENVKLRPLVQELLFELSKGEFVIDLERTTIGKMEMSIDLNALIGGEEAGKDVEVTSCEVNDVAGDPALFRAAIAQFNFSAPGIKILLSGFRIEIHTPATRPAPPIKKVAVDLDGDGKTDLFVDPTDTDQDGIPDELQALQTDGVGGPDPDDPLRELDSTPGFAANVLSNWILMGVRLELRDVGIIVNSTTDCFPDSQFNATTELSFRKFKVKHNSFFGVNRERYNALNKSGTHQAALKYHLMHFPFQASLDGIRGRLGDALEIRIEGRRNAKGKYLDGIQVDVVQDDWKYFKVDGRISQYEVYVGSSMHKSLYSSDTSGDQLTFTVCNMLQRISGNNRVLRRCYKENIGGEGYSTLLKLQKRHKKLMADLALQKDRTKQAVGTAEYDENKTALDALKDTLELSRMSQERFFKKLFFAEICVQLKPAHIDLCLSSLADAGMKIGAYTMGWLANMDDDGDGDISVDEWNAALAKQLGDAVDADGDGEVSLEEWMLTTGADQIQETITLDDMIAETQHELAKQQLGKLSLRFQEIVDEITAIFDPGNNIRPSKEKLAQIEEIVVFLQMFTRDLNEQSNHDSSQEIQHLASQEIQHLARRIDDIAQVLTDQAASMLAIHERSAPLGIQLNLKLDLPTVVFHASGGDQSMVFQLGRWSAECPPSETEEGEKLDLSDCAGDRALVVSEGMSLVISAHDKKYSLLNMPERTVAVIGWTVLPKKLMLLPENLTGISCDIFTCRSSDHKLSTSEPLELVFSEPSMKTLYELAESAAKELRANNDGKIQGLSLDQLHQLYEGMMVHKIYRQWLVPKYVNPESICSFSFQVHGIVQLLLLSGTEEQEASGQTQRQNFGPSQNAFQSSSISGHEKPANTLTLQLRGVAAHLHGSSTYLGFQHAFMSVNAALLKGLVTDLLAATTASDEEIVDLHGMVESQVEKGTTIELQIPSPMASTKESREEARINLVETKGALNGITITAPSIMLGLLYKNPINLDARAVQIKIDGLAAKGILEKHFDSKTEANQAWYAIDSTLEKLTHGQHNFSWEQLEEAIHRVCEFEIAKAATTQSRKLNAVGIYASELEVAGRVTVTQNAKWLHLYSDSIHPLWELHGSLSNPKRVANAMTTLIESPDVPEHLRVIAKEAMHTVNEAAIDYHDLNFSGCTLLFYMAKSAVSDFIDSIKGITAHKPSSPCPDHFYADMTGCKLELASAWPAMGLINHTSAPIGLSGFNWDWDPWRQKMYLVSFLIWFVATLDCMPGLVGFGCFCSYGRDIVELFQTDGYQYQAWQYFLVIIPKNIYLSLYLPVFLCSMANRSAENRFFGIVGGLCAWQTMLTFAAPEGDTMAWPFTTDHSPRVSSSHQVAIDCVMLVATAIAIVAAVRSSYTHSNFEGFASKMKIPLPHRVSVARLTVFYLLFVGVCELLTSLTEKTYTREHTHADWVWPPDGGDCNKVLFLMYSTVKIVVGCYLACVVYFERKNSKKRCGSVQELEHRSQVFTRKVCLGVFSGWTVELVLFILENIYGPEINGEVSFWEPNFVQDSSGGLVSFFCMNRIFHQTESVSHLVWMVLVLALSVYWRMQKFQERCGRQKHEQNMALQFAKLKRRNVERRTKLDVPPARDADDRAWLHWIQTSGVSIAALVDVLGVEAGGKVAIKTARDGIYGPAKTSEKTDRELPEKRDPYEDCENVVYNVLGEVSATDASETCDFHEFDEIIEPTRL